MARKPNTGVEERTAYWLMITPAFFLYLMVLAFPIVLSIILSISNFQTGNTMFGGGWKSTGIKPMTGLTAIFSKDQRLFAYNKLDGKTYFHEGELVDAWKPVDQETKPGMDIATVAEAGYFTYDRATGAVFLKRAESGAVWEELDPEGDKKPGFDSIAYANGALFGYVKSSGEIYQRTLDAGSTWSAFLGETFPGLISLSADNVKFFGLNSADNKVYACPLREGNTWRVLDSEKKAGLSLISLSDRRVFAYEPQSGKIYQRPELPKWKLVGVQEYVELVKDSYFWLALKNNIYVVLISVFGQLPLGFIFAYLIFRKLVRFSEFWQGIIYMPAIISIIVIGILWTSIFSPYGPLTQFMNTIYLNTFNDKLNRLFEARAADVSFSTETVGEGDEAEEVVVVAVTEEFVQRVFDLADKAPKPTSALYRTEVKELITEAEAAAGAKLTKAEAARIRAEYHQAKYDEAYAEVKDLIVNFGFTNIDELKEALTNTYTPKWTADFLNKRDVSMIPVLFVILWLWTGQYMIMFLANMQKIDIQIIEAARIDGATEFQIMGRVILPALSGVIVNMIILAIAGSLNGFALIFAMTRGGPAKVTQVLSIYMYDEAFTGLPNFPKANSISLMIVFFSFILIAVTKVLEKRYGGKE